jgi:hypothetical protein
MILLQKLPTSSVLLAEGNLQMLCIVTGSTEKGIGLSYVFQPLLNIICSM